MRPTSATTFTKHVSSTHLILSKGAALPFVGPFLVEKWPPRLRYRLPGQFFIPLGPHFVTKIEYYLTKRFSFASFPMCTPEPIHPPVLPAQIFEIDRIMATFVPNPMILAAATGLAIMSTGEQAYPYAGALISRDPGPRKNQWPRACAAL